MKSSTTFNASGVVASTLPCGLIRVQGYFRGGTDSWLQIHDSEVAAANTAVPLKSYFQPQTAAFHWGFDPDQLVLTRGLYVAISTAEGSLTLSSEKADFEVEYEPRNFVPSDYSTAGDLATPTDSLQVWTDANGPKKLYQYDAVNNDGGDQYLMLFAKDVGSLVDGDKPIRQFAFLDSNSGNTQTGSFGDGGFDVRALSSANVEQDGCTLIFSTTPGILTQTGGSSNYIRAYYK